MTVEKEIKYIFLADAFSEHFQGGAEFTTSALFDGGIEHIIEKTGGKDFVLGKLLSEELSLNVLEKYKNVHFIVGNFHYLKDEHKIFFCKNISYSILEYDYKLCDYRSPQIHKLAEGKDCDCAERVSGKLNAAFYSYAKNVWFMSDAQRQYFLENIKTLKEENCRVLSSVFDRRYLDFIESIKDTKKDEKYLILGSDFPIKNTQGCVKYAKENNLEYEIIKGLPYHELLIKLSTSKGLIFQPLGYDTCPRLVIEAKILGCDLILSDYVQHQNEEWFATKESTVEHMRSRVKAFWSHYE